MSQTVRERSAYNTNGGIRLLSATMKTARHEVIISGSGGHGAGSPCGQQQLGGRRPKEIVRRHWRSASGVKIHDSSKVNCLVTTPSNFTIRAHADRGFGFMKQYYTPCIVCNPLSVRCVRDMECDFAIFSQSFWPTRYAFQGRCFMMVA